MAVAWTGVFTVVVIAAAIGMTLLYLDRGREAQVAREQRAVAVDAEDEAKSRTWEARLSEAAALRWSGKPERRFLAFDALRDAAAITGQHDDPENLKRLRDSAIACLAIVDMRPASPTYRAWTGVELTAANRLALYIPPVCAAGAQALADDTEMFYLVSSAYSPEHERGLRFDDPAIGIRWPRPATHVSDKDRAWPWLDPSEGAS